MPEQTPSTQPPEVTPPVVDDDVVVPSGQVKTLSADAYNRLKQNISKESAKHAERKILAKVKEMGFETLDEAIAYAKMGRQGSGSGAPKNGRTNGNGHEAPANPGPAPQAPTRQEMRSDPKAQQKYDREYARWQTQRSNYQRSLTQEKTRRRRAERDIEDLRTEMELSNIALEAGVRGGQKAKWAVDLLRTHVAGKSETELKDFNERTFFEGLRNEHPYLFDERIKPATTGTPNAGAPPPPGAGSAAKGAAGADGRTNGFDARKAKPEDVDSQLRQLGINPMGP